MSLISSSSDHNNNNHNNALNNTYQNNFVPSSGVFKDRIPDIFQGQNRKYLLDHSELKLVGFLGQGAFGVVHRGLWRSTDVAVKYVTVEYAKVFFFFI